MTKFAKKYENCMNKIVGIIEPFWDDMDINHMSVIDAIKKHKLAAVLVAIPPVVLYSVFVGLICWIVNMGA